ncbi:unnamed protein product [Effrenium voratum]|nr:unnamed protein product [Effrenium voratum]|eukprot:CAMPEP_0181445204 /NCGR_PEP_ID=MMETSP1110-20121109/25466_1 /TAXON_ID=174948 /ORGANISM="Symbiodinium sp., Strain CCMP421" /LENGTH=487 /DNA_ID=CAMNT_0023569239 /DNA_START=71 /DNA_END=1534 /DNA_ORIENTATION=-
MTDVELTCVAPPAEQIGKAGPKPEVSKEQTQVVEVEKKPPWRAWICLFLVNIVEGIDTQLIPACLFALQRDVNLTLSDVAILTTVQMVLTNVAAPFWGVVADRGIMMRKSIINLGCLGEGISVLALAFVGSMVPMVGLRAMSGFFMASLRPVCNGLVADMTSDHNRGKYFGQMQSGYMLGMFGATMFAGNMANIFLWSIPGWRVVFVLAALFAFLVTGIVLKYMLEPERPPQEEGRLVLDELRAVLRFLKIPTFSVMIMQGVFGGIPWTVMGNNLLYFKLSGLPDWQAAILTSEFTVMGTFGGLLGGVVADFLARRCGLHGRPLSAQFTVAVGIPLMYLQFYGIPAGEGSFLAYATVVACFGLFATWAGSGTNLPILSDIVPARDRSKVMAWEGALESSLATAIGPLFVSILADRIFGYKFGEEEKSGQSIEAATALGKAMAVAICLPWTLTLLAYTLMHWSYPRDMRLLNERRKTAQDVGSPVPAV